MSPPDWAAVKPLFDAALARPRAERQAFVDAASAPAEVRAEVLSLLAHADDSTGWLDRGGIRGATSADGAGTEARTDARTGQRCGPWRLLHLLGSGGMGEVYEAERADGSFEGRAAVKLLKRGLDSSSVLQRFARERRALARLNHPHIARLLDAGLSDDGQPFFVMERVQGQPISQAARGLPLDARLQLFLQLADAVSHAHRHLLVHRDLKPGNVLVDTDGQVKLLDFGIAKALDPAESDGQATAAPLQVFTPNYASPEQVRGEAATTATDVYALGVLLYELITGLRPTGRDATTPAEAARRVLEEAPTRPSALSPQQVPDPHWLATRRRLQGDLDNVLLKALDKSVQGRYASVDAFAADVRAFLGGYPVSAQPPRAAYLVRRFVQRHRLAVAAASVAALAVLGTAGAALWQARQAEQQRQVAEQRLTQLRQLARQMVFKYHDLIETLPGASKARETLLADAARQLDTLAATGDRNDPTLAEELAGTWYRLSRLQGADPSINLDRPGDAERSIDKALALLAPALQRPGATAAVLTQAVDMHIARAELLQGRGALAEADRTLRQALPLVQQALQAATRADNPPLATAQAQGVAISLHGIHARVLGNHMGHAHLGRWQDACTAADQAQAAAQASMQANPGNRFAPDTLAYTLGEQGLCALLAGRPEQADALFTRQVQLRDQMAAAMPDDVEFRLQRGIARAHQARVWAWQGRADAALAQWQQAAQIARQVQAADADNVAARRRLAALDVTLAELQQRAGRPAAAQDASRRALQALPPPQDITRYADARLRAEALLWLARALQPQDPAAALAAARDAVALLQATPGRDTDNVGRRWWQALALGEEALALAALGRPAEAATRARAALQAWGDGQRGAPEPPPLYAAERQRVQRLASDPR